MKKNVGRREGDLTSLQPKPATIPRAGRAESADSTRPARRERQHGIPHPWAGDQARGGHDGRPSVRTPGEPLPPHRARAGSARVGPIRGGMRDGPRGLVRPGRRAATTRPLGREQHLQARHPGGKRDRGAGPCTPPGKLGPRGRPRPSPERPFLGFHLACIAARFVSLAERGEPIRLCGELPPEGKQQSLATSRSFRAGADEDARGHRSDSTAPGRFSAPPRGPAGHRVSSCLSFFFMWQTLPRGEGRLAGRGRSIEIHVGSAIELDRSTRDMMPACLGRGCKRRRLARKSSF